jgi:hypothetical protein
MPRGQTITLDLYTQTPKNLAELFQKSSTYKNNAEIFLKDKYENIGSNHKTDGRFFATHHTAPDLAP